MTPCPACGATVNVSPLARLCEGLTPHEAAVLRIAWAGKGTPVPSASLFDEMYADDPDGGPAPSNMYTALWRAVDGLEIKLAGTGVTVSRAGHRNGIRMTFTVR